MSEWDRIGSLLEQSKWVELGRGLSGQWVCQIRLYYDHGQNPDFAYLQPLGNFSGPDYWVKIEDMDQGEVTANTTGNIIITAYNPDPLSACLRAYQVAYPQNKLPWRA